MLPWRVRVTADGAGTLDAVHATIELVDRAEGAAGGPWAWYRADDLTGYTDGEAIPHFSQWADRTGNGRDLWSIINNPQDYNERHLVWVENALDGRPGLSLQEPVPSPSVSQFFQSDSYDPYSFEGMTFVQVFIGPDWAVRCFIFNAQSTGWELIWRPGSGQEFGAGPGFGDPPYIEGADGAVSDGSAPYAVVGIADRERTELRWNGNVWEDSSGSGVTVVGDDTWWDSGYNFTTGSNSHTLNEVAVNSHLDTLLEFLVFDRSMDPDADLFDFGADGVSTLHQYLAARYPTIFS